MFITRFPIDVTDSQNLANDSLTLKTAFSRSWRLIACLIHWSASVTTQTTAVTFNSDESSNYDTVLKTESVTGTSFEYKPTNDFLLKNGQEITLTSGNTATPAITAYATIIGEEIHSAT